MPAPVWVVIPTYNEAENIEGIVRAAGAELERVAPDGHRILIVDDNSPDGTGQVADRLAAAEPRIEVLHRATKTGLGHAYVAGFSHALRGDAEVVIEMDAVNGELGPDFAALECPTVFVIGTGAHSGATEDEMRTVRAAAADAEAMSKRVCVFATTPHKHTEILTKAPDTVVAAIEAVIHESS